MLEDGYREFRIELQQATERIEVTLPRLLFQEKHTTGWLWWKRTYYTYHRYSEGSMFPVSIYSEVVVDSLEKK